MVEVFDSNELLLSHVGSDNSASQVFQDACVIAVKATDTDIRLGFIASTSSGVVTDDTWRCSDDVTGDSWRSYDFDDSDWQYANITGSNGDQPWGVISDVSRDANWIWGNASENGVLYCRKSLCLGKTVVGRI